MMSDFRILYCHCAYARVVPPEVKEQVLQGLCAAGVEFEAVPDLCAMSARRDPRLAELAREPGVRIAACYPRAVRWLFSAADAPLPENGPQVLNMRVQEADDVLGVLLSNGAVEPLADPAGDANRATEETV
jgi:hypothetical protein